MKVLPIFYAVIFFLIAILSVVMDETGTGVLVIICVLLASILGTLQER